MLSKTSTFGNLFHRGQGLNSGEYEPIFFSGFIRQYHRVSMHTSLGQRFAALKPRWAILVLHSARCLWVPVFWLGFRNSSQRWLCADIMLLQASYNGLSLW